MTANLISLPAPFANSQLDYGAGRVRWWTFRETTGSTPAVFDLYDGTTAQVGQVLMTFSLDPGESTRDFVGHHLIPYEVGLWLQVTSGTVLGTIQVDNLNEPGEAMPVVVIDNLNVVGGG
jgi:hypothetical protein